MQKIKVFPDHCSTGFWDNETGCNLEPDQLGLPEHLLLAVKYWHEVWEFFIARYDPYDPADRPSPATKEYLARWNADGKRLVDLMNECQHDYEFIYKEEA